MKLCVEKKDKLEKKMSKLYIIESKSHFDSAIQDRSASQFDLFSLVLLDLDLDPFKTSKVYKRKSV